MGANLCILQQSDEQKEKNLRWRHEDFSLFYKFFFFLSLSGIIPLAVVPDAQLYKDIECHATQPTLTLSDMQEETGISLTAIQKLLARLISKKYVERGEKDGSWRVFVTQ